MPQFADGAACVSRCAGGEEVVDVAWQPDGETAVDVPVADKLERCVEGASVETAVADQQVPLPVEPFSGFFDPSVVVELDSAVGGHHLPVDRQHEPDRAGRPLQVRIADHRRDTVHAESVEQPIALRPNSVPHSLLRCCVMRHHIVIRHHVVIDVGGTGLCRRRNRSRAELGGGGGSQTSLIARDLRATSRGLLTTQACKSGTTQDGITAGQRLALRKRGAVRILAYLAQSDSRLVILLCMARVRAHQRKDGSQVRAHERQNPQSGERRNVDPEAAAAAAADATATDPLAAAASAAAEADEAVERAADASQRALAAAATVFNACHDYKLEDLEAAAEAVADAVRGRRRAGQAAEHARFAVEQAAPAFADADARAAKTSARTAETAADRAVNIAARRDLPQSDTANPVTAAAAEDIALVAENATEAVREIIVDAVLDVALSAVGPADEASVSTAIHIAAEQAAERVMDTARAAITHAATQTAASATDADS